MSCLSLKEDFASIIQYKISKLNKWKIFRRKKCYNRNIHRHRNLALVYVDDLYTQPNRTQVAQACKHVEAPKDVRRDPEKGVMGTIEVSDNKSLVTGTSTESKIDTREVDDVDLRAEIFIRKFKEEMRRQRHRSFEECS